jgi:hypothetical protein
MPAAHFGDATRELEAQSRQQEPRKLDRLSEKLKVESSEYEISRAIYLAGTWRVLENPTFDPIFNGIEHAVRPSVVWLPQLRCNVFGARMNVSGQHSIVGVP